MPLYIYKEVFVMGKKSGFIVHPYETATGKYHASYGNHNKTDKSFDTLRDAKRYLKRKGVENAVYDSPSGAKDVNLSKPIHQKKKRERNPLDINLGTWW